MKVAQTDLDAIDRRIWRRLPEDARVSSAWILMEHTTKDGRPRLVRRCSYPLTALGAVTRVYTNLGASSSPAGLCGSARSRGRRPGAGGISR